MAGGGDNADRHMDQMAFFTHRLEAQASVAHEMLRSIPPKMSFKETKRRMIIAGSGTSRRSASRPGGIPCPCKIMVHHLLSQHGFMRVNWLRWRSVSFFEVPKNGLGFAGIHIRREVCQGI